MKVNPIYLRYVFERLSERSIQSHPGLLPFGLESVFAEWIQPLRRHQSDGMMVLWSIAVLREPCVAGEIAAMTGVPVKSVLEVILNHSHLFNRTSEGGYVFFHDRFKVYILGTASQQELKGLHKNISRLLVDTMLLKENVSENMVRYAHHHVGHHCLCAGETPQQVMMRFDRPDWLKSFQSRCPSNGWNLLRRNMHHVRIHQRYNSNEEVIESLLQEIRLSLKYDGPDVIYDNGLNELQIDHEDDFVIHAILAMLCGQSGHWIRTTEYLKRSSKQIEKQWGKETLTETLNNKDGSAYYTVLNVLEQLGRLAVEKDQWSVALQTLEMIDEFSWANATRIMMAACCRFNKQECSFELLKFLAGYDWNDEEEHPLEIAAKFGAEEIVLGAEAFVGIHDFQRALYQLTLFFLKANEHSKANPLFAKLIETAKSRDGLTPIYLWTMVVSILGRSRVNEKKLNDAKATLERCLEKESAKEFHTSLIVNECREVERLAPWVETLQLMHGFTFEEIRFKGMLATTVSRDENYLESKRQLNQTYPGFLKSSDSYIVPKDWPKRGFCGVNPPSMAMIRTGLILEWYARQDFTISTLLGLNSP